MTEKGFIVGGLQFYGMLALVITLVGGFGYARIQSLKNANRQLEAQAVMLQQVNADNLRVLNQIKLDKAKADKLLGDLRVQRQKDNKELTGLKASLTNVTSKADPALLDTIRSIQSKYQ